MGNILQKKKVLSLLQERLETFDLKLEGDGATTSDGAAVTETFGKLSSIIRHNHALHLAVTKIFYLKQLIDVAPTRSSGSECGPGSKHERDESNDSDSDKVAGTDKYDISLEIFCI
jgi:hypothetical protein